MNMAKEKISLSYGAGGALMHELIDKLYLKYLANPILNKLTDAAIVKLKSKDVVFTTDSFVVKPLFFTSSDIGKLAVAGTINDLLMLGSRPKYVSLSLIIQEGFSLNSLERIIRSVSVAAKKSKVLIVTGDTKVVDKNSCDGIFINTSGIGEKIPSTCLDYSRIRPRDNIIINGFIASHGLSIISARENLKFNLKSDCESLEDLVLPVLNRFKTGIHFMRDPTRGGLATTLNEIVGFTKLGIVIDEEKIPLSKNAQYACEILGLDPLYMANEGKVILIVDKNITASVIESLRKNRLGRHSSVIGEVNKKFSANVVERTKIGSFRIIEMRSGDPLPRIC
ncbi:MAG: hydrogenase expression/formation protein HypE [Candidatus Omnitrophota bacterium]